MGTYRNNILVSRAILWHGIRADSILSLHDLSSVRLYKRQVP